jgi:hypothetical protein
MVADRPRETALAGLERGSPAMTVARFDETPTAQVTSVAVFTQSVRLFD